MDGAGISVIVASYGAGGTIGACLSSLRRQETPVEFEVIVVDSSPDEEAANVVAESLPEARLLRFGERKFAGEARNLGIAEARGDVIAFIDADCTASETWVEEIARAHAAPVWAVGGAIGNGNPENRVGWAAYFVEFSQWMPGLPAGWRDDIAGANMSYKKETFRRFGHFIEGTYCSDTDFHWRLGEGGHRLWFAPGVVVYHRNIADLRRFLCHEYEHGRAFARVRTCRKGFPWLVRLVYVVLSPLIPVVLLCKIAAFHLRNRRYLGRFLVALPLVVLGLAAWSLGEGTGYARG